VLGELYQAEPFPDSEYLANNPEARTIGCNWANDPPNVPGVFCDLTEDTCVVVPDEGE
jgi:hypothetical protein